MKSEPRKSGKRSGGNDAAGALLYTAGVLVIALALLFFSSSLLSPRRGMMPSFQFAQGFFLVQLLLSTVNVILVLYLFYIYTEDYLQLHSKFTGGLLLFLVSILLYSLTSNPVVHAWFGYKIEYEIYDLVPLAFSTLALLVLAKISAD